MYNDIILRHIITNNCVHDLIITDDDPSIICLMNDE